MIFCKSLKTRWLNSNKFLNILVIDCGSAPEIENGTKSIINSIYVNNSLSLEMNVTYSCDFDLVLIPPDQSRWNCLAGGNWSYSTSPQCLAGKFLVLSVP